MSDDPILNYSLSLLAQANVDLQEAYQLPSGVSEVVLFESFCLLLQQAAPMEFTYFLEVLMREAPKGHNADYEALREAREEFATIFNMISTEALRSSG